MTGSGRVGNVRVKRTTALMCRTRWLYVMLGAVFVASAFILAGDGVTATRLVAVAAAAPEAGGAAPISQKPHRAQVAALNRFRAALQQRMSTAHTVNAMSAEIPCDKALGMSDPSKIPDDRFNASSQYRPDALQTFCGRLNNDPAPGCKYSAWGKGRYDTDPWLQVDLSGSAPAASLYRITGFATQGRGSTTANYTQYPEIVQISYSMDGEMWTFLENGKNFTANEDATSVVKHSGDFEPFRARYVRIHVVEYFGWSCVRAELYGCANGTLNAVDGDAGIGGTGSSGGSGGGGTGGDGGNGGNGSGGGTGINNGGGAVNNNGGAGTAGLMTDAERAAALAAQRALAAGSTGVAVSDAAVKAAAHVGEVEGAHEGNAALERALALSKNLAKRVKDLQDAADRANKADVEYHVLHEANDALLRDQEEKARTARLAGPDGLDEHGRKRHEPMMERILDNMAAIRRRQRAQGGTDGVLDPHNERLYGSVAPTTLDDDTGTAIGDPLLDKAREVAHRAKALHLEELDKRINGDEG